MRGVALLEQAILKLRPSLKRWAINRWAKKQKDAPIKKIRPPSIINKFFSLKNGLNQTT